jgi:adenylate kinase
MLVERVVGRRSDPLTGAIYHMTFKPPPEEVIARLIQRSDDTEEMCLTRLKTYHSNVANVLDYYKDVVVEVRSVDGDLLRR